MNRPIRVKGHADPSWGAPHDPAGERVGSGRAGMGYGRCACGEMTPEVLPSQLARLRWHRLHREELAGVPWA